MRDTNALRLARELEPNPYARRFPYPKWNRTVTVCDEHKLFSQLPEFKDWAVEQHEAEAFAKMRHAITLKLQYRRQVEHALSTFGDGNGQFISGVVRDHFPEGTKELLRALAHASTALSEQSAAHWRAAGKTLSTYRNVISKELRKAGL